MASWLDDAAQIVQQGIDASQQAGEKQQIDQWTEQGRQAGEAQAQTDFQTGNWGVVNQVQQPTDPGIPAGSTYNAFELPSFTNPVVTGLEVALTPSEANVGEFAQSNAFDAGSHDGYSNGMFSQANQAIDSNFAPSPAEPAPLTPNDCLVPALDASPATTGTACDTFFGGGASDNTYSGSDYSAASDTGSGGSYDSDAGSSDSGGGSSDSGGGSGGGDGGGSSGDSGA